MVLDAKNILVGDTVHATTSGGVLSNLLLQGQAGPAGPLQYNYEFQLVWVEQPLQARWFWGDGITSAVNQHQYSHVSGTPGIPLAGVTVKATKAFKPECAALVTQGPAPGTIVQAAALGTYPCTSYPAGADPATWVYTQPFIENSPPAPHKIYQIEPVGR